MCLRSKDILHFLFWWAGTLGQSILHSFLCSKARLQSTIVSLEGPELTRGARVRVLDIFHIIQFLGD